MFLEKGLAKCFLNVCLIEITVSQGLVPTDKLARGSLLSEIVSPHPGGKRGRENDEGGGRGRDRDRDRDRDRVGRRAEESGRRREGAREEGGRGKRSGKDKEGKGE